MNIILNGKVHSVADGSTVKDLLQTLGLADRPVVVELDEEALLAREHTTAALKEGCRIEVVQITAGG
jgi:sulfur carrier protein